MADMTEIIIRTMIFAICGLGASQASRIWTMSLMKNRSLDYTLSKKTEILLTVAMIVLGGITGAVTVGIAYPVTGILLLIICETVTVTDWNHRVIPNPAVLAIMVLKLITLIPSLLNMEGAMSFEILQSLIGLAACFFVFTLPGLIGKNVGAGDVKLAAAMGFFLGIYYSLLGVVFMGLLVVAYVFAQRRMPILMFIKTDIPMGPFIAAGMYAAFILAPMAV